MKVMSSAGAAVEKRSLLFAAALTAVLAGAFMLLWWDRFLGGTGVDGSFFVSARLILEGKIPYRDFNMSVPPLEALKVAGLIRLFGDYLILPRVWGLGERIVLGGLMCFWLGRFFRIGPAFLAATLGIIVFCSALADPVSGYNHSSSFWAVAAGLAGSLLLDSQTTQSAWLRGSICGACACLSFLTKQTTGFGVTLVIVFVVALSAWKKGGLGRAGRLVLPYAAGWLVPFALICAWLQANHGLGPFFDLVFVHGPSSKGSLVESLLRPLTMTLEDPWLRQEALAAVLLLIALYLVPRFVAAAPGDGPGKGQVTIFFLISAGALAAAYLASTHPAFPQRFYRMASMPRVFLFLSLFGGAATFLYFTWRWLRGQLSEGDAQFWLISGISFAAAYMHSLSFVTTESMVLPGGAFVLAWGLDRIGNGRLTSRWAMPLSAVCVAGMFCAATLKLATPFSWYGWKDAPVNEASQYSSLPQLRGIRMSPRAAAFVERLATLVESPSARQQPIYVFFYLPLGYILPDRDPSTFAYIHFIDVASDAITRSDNNMLRAKPPAVIVYTEVPDAETTEWEREFRGGRHSGQRDLIATLNSMVVSYKLLDTLQMPGSERPVKVYARN
jgi:hypothetical protein